MAIEGETTVPNHPAAPGTAPILLFGLLPLAGLLAELGFGALSTELPLFPTWWHVGAVLVTVVLNLLLHFGVLRDPRHVLPRAVAVGCIAGTAGLYALAEAPAIPVMVFLVPILLGVLAMAPYFALLGLLRFLPALLRDWRASGRSATSLALLLLALAIAPTTNELLRARAFHGEAVELALLASAMRDPAREDEAERIAARLRTGDVEAQRAFCAFGSRSDRTDDRPFDFGNGIFRRTPLRRADDRMFFHLADGAPFWFERWFAVTRLATEPAREAFHRAHGIGWNDGDAPIEALAWRGGRDNEWLSSRIEVHVEPDAALAKVDWILQATSHSRAFAEARFDLHLPPLAEATSLSSWIDGKERPAAFGGNTRVQEAYDAVVRKMRDPALLQEIAPQRLRLLLFPLRHDLPAMRVRIGFTVPFRMLGEKAELWLPQITSHTCRHARVAKHELVVDGATGSETKLVDDEALLRPLPMPGGAQQAQARDADGFVVQRLEPRPPVSSKGAFVVVVDGSASVASVVCDPVALLAAFPTGTDAVLFVAHGSRSTRCEGKVGSAELAAAVAAAPRSGGVDARTALQQACDEAKRKGLDTIYWLHGAAAACAQVPWPDLAEGVRVATFALHPGQNVVLDELRRAAPVIDLSRHGTAADWQSSLAEALAGDPMQPAFGDRIRVYERRDAEAADVRVVSDQLARLWAAQTARSRQASDPRGAAQLAARYRVVAAGVGAVVLESSEQYEAAGLDPGAPIGREPMGPVGGAPTPEPSTWLLFASGLAAAGWWQRRTRARSAAPASS